MYQAAVWLRKVQGVYGDRLQLNWKNFALEEINKKQPPGWHVWDQPDDYPSRGLPAFRAAEAARRQGEAPYDRMLLALLDGRHERRKDFTEPDDIEELAREAGLDMERFKRDLADRSLLQRVAEDHAEAVSRYGVFGTPTLVFDGSAPVFVRIRAPESARDAARAFERLHELFAGADNIDEVKRPLPPEA